MLKPILAAACLTAAGLTAAPSPAQSQQAPSGLSGQQIAELVAGATVEVDTPAGTKLPLSYGRDGKVAGEAGELAWYLGAAADRGRWWVADDRLCHRWKTWFNSEPQCLRLSRRGRVYHWQSADGSTGTARVTAAPASIAAATVPHWRPGRMLRSAVPPAARPATEHAHAPAARAPAPVTAAPQQHAAAEPAPPAADAAAQPVPPVTPPVPPPAAQAPAAAATLPSLLVPPAAAAPVPLSAPPAPRTPVQPATSAWPAHQAGAAPHPETHPGPPRPQAQFRVANVRADDVLNVRAGPSADHDIVGELAPGSRGIAITARCRSRWCPVQHDALSGWVNSAYLAPEIVPAALHAPADTPHGVSRDSALGPRPDSSEAPRACLAPAARSLLDRIERSFGRVEVVSTCRAGAFIAGTRRPSRHASGNAVDFKAGVRKAAILEWLIANHRAGGIMTYAGMDHIHVDIGPRFVSLAGRTHFSSWRNKRGD